MSQKLSLFSLLVLITGIFRVMYSLFPFLLINLNLILDPINHKYLSPPSYHDVASVHLHHQYYPNSIKFIVFFPLLNI